MSEQVNDLRRINWSECFPFTRIFRTFGMAKSPGKLAMALAAVLLTCLWGGILDGLWSSKHQPLRNEVGAFIQVASIDQWREGNRKATVQALRSACNEVGATLPVKLEEEFARQPSKVISDVLKDIKARHKKTVDDLANQLGKEKNLTEQQRRERTAEKAKPWVTAYAQVRNLRPRGVFCGFASYECQVGRQLMHAARTLNFTGGLHSALSPRGSGPTRAAYRDSVPGMGNALVDLALNAPDRPQEPTAGGSFTSVLDDQVLARGGVGAVPAGYGVLPCVILALRGVQWMWVEHTLYFFLFWIPALVIWSLFGGALSRMAALDLARDEQISPKVALCFAWRKLLGFVSAPLVPIVFIIAIGLVHLLGGAFGFIPWIGEFIGGIIAGLALVGGALMALLAIGAVAGGGLMWPTIAAEGSDGFDAMSRSYSYIFTRPWHAAFYAVIVAVYGAICYLFVRFFLFLALRLARVFVGMGMGAFAGFLQFCGADGAGDRSAAGAAWAQKVDVIWPAPTFANLAPARMPLGADGLMESGMAWMLHMWMLLVVALLFAFMVSFFMSGSTVIYFLLRRHVDATDIDDVFVEEGEEGGEPPASGSASTATGGSVVEPASGPVPSSVESTGTPGPSTSTEPKPPASEPPASPLP
ncbi:MAG TPA: hypothetical protein PKY77_13615 [Phycisphaerae bacterium]|nr:hypothetical protein [Phycisphaerae bacterium]HRY68781.1 hypothetical protein [Phycisphaerae bacterium]HSA28896.1 hypothetical protein [Phycisphaerae bacterium]